MPCRAANPEAMPDTIPLQVFCIAADPTGQWLASGGADSTLRIWDASTGRCTRTWKLEEAVRSVAWCPSLRILSAAAGRSVYLLPSGASWQAH